MEPGCHIDDFGKRKKNCTFHLSSWLESHLDKSSVFFWKKKNKAQTKQTRGGRVLEYITRAWCQDVLCSPQGLPRIPCAGDGSMGFTSLSAGQLSLTSEADPGPGMFLGMDFTVRKSWGWPCNFQESLDKRPSIGSWNGGLLWPEAAFKRSWHKKKKKKGCCALEKSLISDYQQLLDQT